MRGERRGERKAFKEEGVRSGRRKRMMPGMLLSEVSPHNIVTHL